MTIEDTNDLADEILKWLAADASDQDTAKDKRIRNKYVKLAAKELTSPKSGLYEKFVMMGWAERYVEKCFFNLCWLVEDYEKKTNKQASDAVKFRITMMKL